MTRESCPPCHAIGDFPSSSTTSALSGSAIGVAVFGAIATNVIAAGRGEHDYATIVTASTWVFAAVALTAALMLLAALRLPRGGVDSTAYATATPTR